MGGTEIDAAREIALLRQYETDLRKLYHAGVADENEETVWYMMRLECHIDKIEGWLSCLPQHEALVVRWRVGHGKSWAAVATLFRQMFGSEDASEGQLMEIEARAMWHLLQCLEDGEADSPMA